MLDRRYAAAYLAGLFDGEGTVSMYHTDNGKYAVRRLSITNTEKAILDRAADCLEVLSIEYSIYQRNLPTKNPKWNTAWDLNVYGRRNIVLFCRYVKVASEAKRIKLKALRKSYPGPSRRYRRFYTGWKYETIVRLRQEGWSLQRIADHFGTYHEMIRQALLKGGQREATRRDWRQVE